MIKDGLQVTEEKGQGQVIGRKYRWLRQNKAGKTSYTRGILLLEVDDIVCLTYRLWMDPKRTEGLSF